MKAARLGTHGLLAMAAAAAAQAPPGRGDDDILLFQLRLGQVSLNEAFQAFPVPGGIIIPFGQLCRDLELGILVDPGQGLANGFLIEEARTFYLDARNATLKVGATTILLDRSQIEVRPDDIYLDTRLLAQVLPVDFQVGLRSSVLTLVARQPLPLQERWKREGGAGRLSQSPRLKTFNPIADPYRMFEFPAVDLTLGLGLHRGGGGGATTDGQASLVTSGDLLGLSTSLLATRQTPGGIGSFRLTMGRTDPHGGLLGPLGATTFALGAVFSRGLSLATLPRSGNGASISSFPLQGDNAYDRHSFTGTLAPGWQVELYQNQGLLGFQKARPDGRYEFLNIPLTFGWNDFMLVFFGPQGQRREEVVHFDVSQSQTPKGAFYYSAVGLQAQGPQGHQLQFNSAFGLTRQLSALFGTTQALLGGVEHTYTQAGLQGFLANMASSLTAASDNRGGSSLEAALRTRIGFLSLGAKETTLRGGFQSEIFPTVTSTVLQRTTLEGSATLPNVNHPLLTLDFSGSRDHLANGGSIDALHGRAATSVQGWYLANQLNRNVTRDPLLSAEPLTTGEVLVSRQIARVNLRGQAGYDLSAGRHLTSLTLMAEGSPRPMATLQGSIAHTVADRATAMTLATTHTAGGFTYGASLGYGNRAGLSANFTLRLGIGREPRQGHFTTRAQGATGYGAVSIHAFVDSNGNGVQDPGEKPLPGLGFLINGSSQQTLTDSEGVSFLQGLPQDVDAHLAVNTSTLEDPLMRPALTGVRITPRGGHVVRLEMPVVLLGELNGTTYRLLDGVRSVLPGLRVELRNAQGQVIRSQRAANDGFFTFTEVPSGTYRLEVPEAAAKALDAPVPAALTISIATEGTILDGLELVVAIPSGPGARPEPGLPAEGLPLAKRNK
jgi:hypothetical protein